MLGKKIAVVGAHGSGKGVLVHELTAALKKRDIHVGVTRESARSSPYLIAEDIAPELEVGLLGRQLVEETDAIRQHELVICDRSVFDIVMYSRLLFPNLNPVQRESFAAIEKFAVHYARTYDAIFRMTTLFDPRNTNDPMRPKDPELQRRAHKMLPRVLDELGVSYMDVLRENQVSFVIGTLEDRGIISK